MGYLRGDYYAGDYMRGDFGSFFKKAVKFAAPALFPFMGIPAAFAAGYGGKTVSKVLRGGASLLPGPLGTAARVALAPQLALGSAIGEKLSSSAAPGGPSNLPARISPPSTAMVGPMMDAGYGPGRRRTHPNRSTYVTRGGGTSHWPQELAVHFKGTELVPSRRMNVANPRALRRALRRVAGFGKLTKRARRAVSMAASALGVHRGARRKKIGR